MTEDIPFVKMGMFSLQVRTESGLHEAQAVLRDGAVQIKQDTAPRREQENVEKAVEEWCEEHDFAYVD